jgi:dihydrodipicolinate synthase/N-acetylneuraminate lyase
MNETYEERQALTRKLFPEGIPWLWCPPLTHFGTDGSIDFARMAAHFRNMSPWVGGLLIPGTSGQGWDLNDEETLSVTSFALQMSREYKTRLLLGALRTDMTAIREMIARMMKLIETTVAMKGETVNILSATGVCGFAVCPLKGKSLSQTDIEAGLSTILEMGLPVALYQLPSVTENEAAPETFQRLVRRYPNLIFFKDSSGRDFIAASSVDKGGVFLARGAEGDYIRWLKAAGGPYDGFLLSVANSFAPQLTSFKKYIDSGDHQRAGEISERVTKALFETVALVGPLSCGRPYTNANKSIDHFFAFGRSALAKEGPMLRGGIRIPSDILSATGDILRKYGLMPEKGYLET